MDDDKAVDACPWCDQKMALRDMSNEVCAGCDRFFCKTCEESGSPHYVICYKRTVCDGCLSKMYGWWLDSEDVRLEREWEP